MTSILILGSTGFIGKNLKNLFEEHDDYKVYAPNRSELNLLNPKACENYLSKTKPDIVIFSVVDINSIEKSVLPFFNIYRYQHNFKYLINLGSGAEYDRNSAVELISEEEYGRSIPTDTYSASKFIISNEIENSLQNKFFNIRLFGVFGPYEDSSRRFISNNILNIKNNSKIVVNKNMVLDYISVWDLYNLITLIIPKLPLPFKSFNFCRGRESISLLEIAKIIKLLTNTNLDIEVKDGNLAPPYTGSNKKISEFLRGFELMSLESSIRKLYKYYLDNPESLK